MALGPADRGPQVLAVYLLFLALTTITTALRVYVRSRIVKSLGWDDWFSVLAWAFFVFYTAFAVHGVFHGTGQHAWNIHPSSELVVALKSWWLCEPFYVLASMAIKASIALMLLRFLVTTWHRLLIIAIMVVTELLGVAFLFLFIFQCIPSAYFWTRYTGAEGSCLETSSVIGMVYAYSSILCVGDWVYFLLPCYIVFRLQMLSRAEKAVVGLVFGLSVLASIATIIRLPYVHLLSDTDDFLYATTDVAIWSCIETGLAITACCAATLRPLFARFVGGSRGVSNSSDQQKYLNEQDMEMRSPLPKAGAAISCDARSD